MADKETCPWCLEEFESEKSHLGYCSFRCLSKYRRYERVLRARQAPQVRVKVGDRYVLFGVMGVSEDKVKTDNGSWASEFPISLVHPLDRHLLVS